MSTSKDQQQRMEQKRAKILEQAVLLFSEQGFNDTTVSKVAKASGVSFGSVFTYFATKEELFHHAVMEPLEELKAGVLDFDEEAEDALAEIERLVGTQIQLFSRLSTYLRLVVQVIGQEIRFAKQFEELNAFHDEFRKKLSLLIVKGQKDGQLEKSDPLFTAGSYISFLMGIRLTTVDEPDQDLWEEFAPFAIRLFGPIR
ncbi:TetR/AcrR family transcriptional regulator [Jeotgalibacillus sp. ET6]|uniref:TetR/AcrR family transcriptional regulator n=1 Tax=Jeotgalibacillus sp. ET6 TaxID=3037260 RepID=UPI002418A1F0|nr:TetR/AcrR family transcriptional regulator [Jeotgalibacillus sp. ET6]MDG5472071.1 TetR/AcrR family transcriptional regulator [Jeotgalibacillus sp. ET6]